MSLAAAFEKGIQILLFDFCGSRVFLVMAAPRSPDFEYAPVPSSTATQEQSKGNTEPKHVLVNTNPVTPSLTEKHGDSALQRPGWTSTYLQNKTLLGFAIAFLCLLLAVIVLAVVDAKQDGIANAKSSEHYLWTYGPTAGACPISPIRTYVY